MKPVLALIRSFNLFRAVHAVLHQSVCFSPPHHAASFPCHRQLPGGNLCRYTLMNERLNECLDSRRSKYGQRGVPAVGILPDVKCAWCCIHCSLCRSADCVRSPRLALDAGRHCRSERGCVLHAGGTPYITLPACIDCFLRVNRCTTHPGLINPTNESLSELAPAAVTQSL